MGKSLYYIVVVSPVKIGRSLEFLITRKFTMNLLRKLLITYPYKTDLLLMPRVPTYMSRAYILREEVPPTTEIAKNFGVITSVSGIVGVVSGTFISSKWKHRIRSSAPDCWVRSARAGGGKTGRGWGHSFAGNVLLCANFLKYR